MQAVAQLGLKRSFTVTTERKQIADSDSWDRLTERIQMVPESAQVRGMFLREVKRLSIERTSGRYVPFSMYPVREYMELLVQTARVRYPQLSPASALLELGLGVYDLFAQSMAGVAILSVAGSDFGRVCEVASKAYAITLKPGEARADVRGEREVVMSLRNVWPFPEYFHCGIWLGVMNSCKVHGSVHVRPLSASSADLTIDWSR